MTARVPQPEPRRGLDDPAQDRSMDCRVAHDAAVRPALAGLELRLHQRDDRSPPSGPNVEAIGPSTSPSEMNDTSIDRQVDRLGEASSAVSVRALVRSIETTRGSRASALGELAAPDVDARRPGRAALQQHVREAAGRRTRHRGNTPGRIDAERVERGGELVAAAADVRLRRRRPRSSSSGSTRSPAFRSSRAPIAEPDPDLAAEDQRLGTGARLRRGPARP